MILWCYMYIVINFVKLYLICLPFILFKASSVSEDDNESVLQSSRAPNTSALETLVRTACESLAVSTLLAGNSSSNNLLDAPCHQPSQDTPVGHASRLRIVASNSSASSNLYAPSTSALGETSAADDAVFSVIFGHRDPNSRASAVEEEHDTSQSKDLPEPSLDLTHNRLSDMGDVEVWKLFKLGFDQYIQ